MEKSTLERCTYYALSFVLLCTGLSGILLGNTAYAGTYSYHEGRFKKTDKLMTATVESTNTGMGRHDLTYTWSEFMNTCLDAKIANSNAAAIAFKDRYETNLDTGSGWAVQALNNHSNATAGVRIILFEPDAELGITELRNGSQTYLHPDRGTYSVFEVIANGTKNWADPTSGGTALCNYVDIRNELEPEKGSEQAAYMSYQSTQPYLFIASDNIQYPNDWEGDTINTQVPILTVIVPRVAFTVDNKTIKGSVISPVGGSNTAWVKLYDQFDTLLYEYTKPEDGVVFEYEFANYGDYKLVAYHPAPPPPFIDDDDVVRKELVIDPLVINGNGYFYDSDDVECTENESVVCSGINDEVLSPVERALRDISANLYGVQALVYKPIEFFATIPSRVANCSPISVPLLGQNLPLQCPTAAIKAEYPALITVISTMINGLVAIFIGYKTFNLIQRVQSPVNDKIEVSKL